MSPPPIDGAVAPLPGELDRSEVLVNPWGRVPLLVLRHRPIADDPVRGRPMAGSLSRLNRWLFNLVSELRQHMRDSVFAMLQVPVNPRMQDKMGKVEVGSQTGLKVSEQSTRDYKWIAPPPDVAATYEARINGTEEQMHRIGRVGSAKGEASGQAQSGLSRAFEFEKTNRAIADYAKQVALFDERALKMVSRMEEAEAKDLTVTAPERFDVEELARSLEDALSALDLKLGPTAEEQLRLRIVERILPNLDKDTRKKVEGELAELGIELVGVAIDGFDPGLNERWSLEQMGVYEERCSRVGIDRVITIVAEPTTKYVAELAEELPKWIEALRPVRIELDLEGQYEEEDVDGYADLAAAGAALCRVAGALPLQVTTFPYHREARARSATVMPSAASAAIQAYSVRTFNGKRIPFYDHLLSPGRFQKFALGRLSREFPKVAPIAGLAAYDQSWPGRTPREAMRLSYAGAVSVPRVHEAWWWSWKHVDPENDDANDYAFDIIRELTGRDTAVPPPAPAAVEPSPKRGPDLERARRIAAELAEVLS